MLGPTLWGELQGVPRKGVWTSVNARVWTCEELRVKHHRNSCFLRPPFLGTTLVLSKFWWHYLSNATCLRRPHLLYLCFVVNAGTTIICKLCTPCLKKICARQVVLDKWFPLDPCLGRRNAYTSPHLSKVNGWSPEGIHFVLVLLCNLLYVLMCCLDPCPCRRRCTHPRLAPSGMPPPGCSTWGMRGRGII